ncbi:MAG: endonuclease domain-containing protein [Thermomicrobiales bacterium]
MDQSKTTPRIRGTSPGLEAAARQLRRRLTSAERVLWEAIKGKQLAGLRFRQQHPVGPFVLDFYCPACKLVVELDGEIHREQIEQDAYRDQHLAAYGYTIPRFRNEEVLRNLPSVLTRIAETAASITNNER